MAVVKLRAHWFFDDLLERLEDRRVSRARVADVLTRLMIAAPAPLSQSEIVRGERLLRPYELTADSVSRATAALNSLKLVTPQPAQRVGAGRPSRPLQLGSPSWAMIGVRVGHEAGHTAYLQVLATGLDGQPLDIPGFQSPDDATPVRAELPAGADLVETMAQVIEALCAQPSMRARYILGVGVEVSGHVFEGVIITASSVEMNGVKLAPDLSERLGALAERLSRLVRRLNPFPVIVDNDVNVLGVLQTYRPDFPELDLAVIGVFDDGVGSALILGGLVYRGGRGMAGEIGHLQVRLDPDDIAGDAGAGGFAADCRCGRPSHLDCYATPRRILAHLGETDFDKVADLDGHRNDRLTTAGQAFHTGGKALGIGIAGLIDLINPARVLVLVPPALYEPRAGSAAEIYWRATEETIRRHVFSDAADGTIVVRRPITPAQRDHEGARAAAIRVLDSFLQHAKRQCECYRPRARAADDPVEFAPTA
jgi:predicted NBD/HSP70 family sugar kinase